jgi:homocysteine S-methyltransferase
MSHNSLKQLKMAQIHWTVYIGSRLEFGASLQGNQLMTYRDLKQHLDAGGIAILDGGTGTELQKRGADMDPAAWCGPATLENEKLLGEIHGDYIRAGADVITANTYASSRLMLSPVGYGDRVEEINRRAVEAALTARKAGSAERGVLVAGSLSHMISVTKGTARFDPALAPSDSEVADAFAEMAAILKASGVDFIILEMMYHPGRAALAVDAALATGLPVWFGLSARRGHGGRVVSFDHTQDLPVDDIARLIPAGRVDVAGCMHTGPDMVGEALDAVRRHFAGPLMAYPDGGYFEMPEWRFVDVIDPARLEEFYREWIAAGAQVIGGCCGLTVDHIEAAARVRNSLA